MVSEDITPERCNWDRVGFKELNEEERFFYLDSMHCLPTASLVLKGIHGGKISSFL